MSIINDALKKTQQNFERHRKVLSSGPTSSSAQPSQKFSEITGAIIIASFLASLVVLGVVFLFGPKEKTIVLPAALEDKSSLAGPSLQPTDTAEPPIAIAPAPSRDPKPKNSISGLTLNGIVQMGEGYVALINNRILKEGDKINDKKILGIYSDQVKVFDNGEIIILKRESF